MGRAPNRRDLSTSPGPRAPGVGTAGKDIVRNPAPSRKQAQQEPVQPVIFAEGAGRASEPSALLNGAVLLLRLGLGPCRGDHGLQGRVGFAELMDVDCTVRVLVEGVEEAVGGRPRPQPRQQLLP